MIPATALQADSDRSRQLAVHVSFFRDTLQRAPAELMEAWPTLHEVARAVQRAGTDVAVVQAAHTDAVLERDGVRFYFVSEGEPPFFAFPPRPRIPRRPRRLLSRATSLQPHVIHLQGLSFPFQTRYLARAAPGIPILAQDHASRPFPGWRRAVHRWGLAPLAGVAFTAREQARPFVEGRVLRPHIPVYEVIEGSTWFSPGDRPAARQVTGVSGDPCLIWVGHLNENKDPLMVLDALSRAAPAIPGARLWLCYRSAPLLDQVRRRIGVDPALRQRVTLVGDVPHARMEQYFRATDLVVSGSHFEGSGYSVIEAMACGVTPLVTDIPSFRRITGAGSMGALVPHGDSQAMADALVSWSARLDPVLRAQTRAHFERTLSFDAIGAQLCGAYRAVVAAT